MQFCSGFGYSVFLPLPLDCPGDLFEESKGCFTRIPNFAVTDVKAELTNPSLLDFSVHSANAIVSLSSSWLLCAASDHAGLLGTIHSWK